ncbi:unnamed protein product [Closterium sp. NIES-54]
MGRHLATFTRRSGSSLYTLATKPPQVAVSARVSASGQVPPLCSCHLLSHQTLLWHHRLGHPSLPRLCGMHSCLLVSGLPRSLPPLPPSPAPPCLPCVEGRQCAAPHSSSFPPTTAPLQTLHMDVWGPARVTGQGRERCFLLVVDDYSRYTTVFPLRSKDQVVDVLIPWICTVRLQLREQFSMELHVLRLHSESGAWGAETGGAETGGAETGGAETGGAEPEGVALGGAESEGAESGGAEPQGTASSGGSAGALPRLSPQQLHEWLVRRAHLRSGASGAGGAGAAGAGGAGVPAIAGVTGGTAATGTGGVRTRGTGAAETGGVGGAGAGDPTESGAARGSSPGGGGGGEAGVGGTGVGGTGEGGAGAGRAGAVDPVDPGSLHEEIWMRRPPSFTGSFLGGTQWSLRRPVYGLHQAPNEWHDTLRTTLAALGFAPSTADPSLFLRTDTSLPPFYVLLYVDELVFANADTEALTLVKSELQKRHTCTDLGELRSYLGLQITWDRALRTITLTQSHMVHQVLQPFGFQFSSPQPIPLSTSHSISTPPSDESVELSGPYPELVGCLMNLMTCTRPDLAYPLSLLARYVAPGRHRKVHWDAAKRVLRSLCSTTGMGLVLGGRGLVVLTGHADASWVDDSATQQSSQGYSFSLGSGSISWRSTRSSSVLSSSCEAEIYAGAIAAQELRWLTYLLTDLGEQPRSPPVLYVDNKAMIALCQEHKLEQRTKHIALRYFFARELQQRGQLRLAYVATRANTADIFSKALPPGDHQCFSTVLGLVLTLPHLLTA